jgi:tetratricopeptide (TPR) repeat protein
MIAAMYEFDWQKAERLFQMAMAREPVPTYVRWYYAATYLLPAGRVRESAEQCGRGLKDDPLSFTGRFHAAAALLAAGKEDEGEAQLRELCAIYPNLYQPFYLLGLSQSLRGSHAEALASAESAYALAPWNTGAIGILAGALTLAGERRAEELLGKLLPGERYGTALGMLVCCVVRGEMEQAASWAWKVMEQRDPRLIFVVALLRAPSRNLLVAGEWAELGSRLGVPLRLRERDLEVARADREVRPTQSSGWVVTNG